MGPTFRLIGTAVAPVLAFVAAVGSVTACSSGSTAGADRAAKLASRGRSSTAAHRWSSHGNLVCSEFCERLSSCWYAEPDADQRMVKQEVIAECRREESDCLHVTTTDTYCCAWLSDCKDFVDCQAHSRGIASDCKLAQTMASGQPPTFEAAGR